MAIALGAIDSTRIGNCDGGGDRQWRNLQSQAKAEQINHKKAALGAAFL